MYQIILVIHILLSLSIIGLVLLQRGKGSDMGAGFGGGGGASQTLFGSGGSASFLTRTTGALATAFFISCVMLSYLAVNMSANQAESYLPEPPVAVETVAPTASDLPNIMSLNESAVPAEIPKQNAPASEQAPSTPPAATQ